MCLKQSWHGCGFRSNSSFHPPNLPPFTLSFRHITTRNCDVNKKKIPTLPYYSRPGRTPNASSERLIINGVVMSSACLDIGAYRFSLYAISARTALGKVVNRVWRDETASFSFVCKIEVMLRVKWFSSIGDYSLRTCIVRSTRSLLMKATIREN